MNLIDLISQNKLSEAKELVYNQLNSIAAGALEELKPIVVENTYVEDLYEAGSPNRIKMGRVVKIRRRIRRNKKGRIIVQKNVRRSAIKGYRISGNTVRRISATQRINKARKLKRYWKTKGKAKLGRTLLKRKMSLRRRKSMGIR
jgi:hypothetical protein